MDDSVFAEEAWIVGLAAETTEQLKSRLGHLEYWIRYTSAQLEGLRDVRERVLVELEKRETLAECGRREKFLLR
jgi:hypothetical protein